MKKTIVFASLSILTLLSCSKKKDAEPTPAVVATTPTPNPNATNVKAVTKKPSVKPNIATGVKNGASNSVRVTSATASTDKSKNGTSVSFLATVPKKSANLRTTSTSEIDLLIGGNNASDVESGDEIPATMHGWAVSNVVAFDPANPADSIEIYSTDASMIDSDSDGTEDAKDEDDDNDGILDTADPDDDGDGVSDTDDDADDDNDGIADMDDLDDDNDGIQDTDEMLAAADSDNDGTLDATDTDDDNDGIMDDVDTDDDGDGINDDDEDDLITLDEDFDFTVFFYDNGEYITYDPSDSEDAWDFGNWYTDVANDFIALDLGTADEEVFEIESVNETTMVLSSYDEESGLVIHVTLKKLDL